METAEQLVARGAHRLTRPGIEHPRREASLLLAYLLGLSEASLLARDRAAVDPDTIWRFDELVRRRASGEPAAYLLGAREFWGRSFRVDSRVLIPRPETEHLVELTLALDLPADACVADVGTGSGALAVTLAAERPRWRVLATDISLGALAVAHANARRHGVATRVWPVATDLLAGIDFSRIDAVVSNPPYVAPAEREDLQAEVALHEPELALYASDDGLGIIERLLREARALRPGGWLASEIGAGQRDAAVAAAQEIGGWELADVRRDLAGRDRVVLWKRTAAAD